jgi:tetratricopeptide (TPR) repeat protein
MASPLDEAIAAHRAGRLGEAEQGYRRALEAAPDEPRANLMLGILAAQTDREEIAVPHLIRAAVADPANFEACQWLTRVLSYLGRLDQAETYAERAARLRPSDYGASFDLATVLFGQGRYAQASKEFMRAIRLVPSGFDAYIGLANSFIRLGDLPRARLVLRDAGAIADGLDALIKLGEAALACEEPDAAITCANRVLAAAPEHTAALLLLVRAHDAAQRDGEKDEALERLCRVAPDDPVGLVLIARQMQTKGQFEQAEDAFRRSIARRPQQGCAYYGIVAGRRIREDDQPLVDQMEAALTRGAMIPNESVHLRFALGKAYDNLGDYGRAMAHFDEGNRLMRQMRGGRRFDRAALTRQIDRIIGLLTPEFLAGHSRVESYEPIPIIVAGMMRSGTTLAEQILSCHTQVGAAGEQVFWRSVEAECVNYESASVDIPAIRRCAAEYVELLSRIAPGRTYVTDKNPANRLIYGLIRIALPQTRIIHMARHPADVAISLYTTLMHTGAAFVGDRDDIVFALKENARLAEHWNRVLPPDRFLQVQYEDLIRDRERVTRDMVEFCGLTWDEGCLRPEENLRAIVTPSLWQVRQPVYTGSVDRWRRYEPWLGPFAELLDQ